MADATYTPKVYRKQGGDELVVASSGAVTVESGGDINVASGGEINVQAGADLDVESGGKIQMLTGSKIVPNSGTQAAAIANATGGATGTDFTHQTKINSIIAALEGVGILATS